MKPDGNSRKADKIILPLKMRDKILNKLRKVLQKWDVLKNI